MWLERVRQTISLRARQDHTGLATQNHLRNTPNAVWYALRCAQSVLMSFTSSSDLGVTRDSNLVDSASSIRLSQRLSHACLSINDFIL